MSSTYLKYSRLLVAAAVFLYLGTPLVLAASNGPSDFSYEGVLRDSGGNLITSSTVKIRFAILPPSTSGTPNCAIARYETGVLDLSSGTGSNGYFSVGLGDSIAMGGGVTVGHPGNTISVVFQNRYSITGNDPGSDGVGSGSTCTYVPTGGDTRRLQVWISVNGGGSWEAFSQLQTINAVPSAAVAESFQGYGIGQFTMVFPSASLGVGTCSALNSGMIVFVSDQNKFQKCTAGTWTDQNLNGVNAVTSVLGTAPISAVSGTTGSFTVSLAAGGVGTSHLAAGAVDNSILAGNAVNSAKISDGSVTLADLATDSVNSAKLVDGSVATADLANGSVTAAKLFSGTATGDVLRWDGTAWQAVQLNSTAIVGVSQGVGITVSTTSGVATVSADAGTTANKLLQLNGSSQIPAVDGSLLTSVNASSLQTRAVSATAPAPNEVLRWNGASWTPTNIDSLFVSTSAGTIAGVLQVGGPLKAGSYVDMQTNKVQKLGWATSTDDAVSKLYADTRLAGTTISGAPTNGQVLTWDSTNTQWIYTTPSGGAGDITDVTAGAGLTGGATSGSATLGIASNSVVTGMLGTGAVTGDKIGQMGAATGDVLAWWGTTWAPFSIDPRFVNVMGDTMSGTLKMSANKISSLGFATATDDAANALYVHDYVGAQVGGLGAYYLRKTGDTISGQLGMSGNRIVKLGSPAATDDAVNRLYADTYVAGTTIFGAPSNGQVLTWDSTNTRWIYTTPSGGAGDISDVIAGAGLTGGAATGSATLSIGLNSIATSMIGAGAVSGDKIGQMGASTGDVLAWSGSIWAPLSVDSKFVNVTGDTMTGSLRVMGSIDTDSEYRQDGFVVLSNDSSLLNVSVGTGAGIPSSGMNNTSVGFEALRVVGFGNDNTAVGANALWNHASSQQNVAIGRVSLYNLVSGQENLAVGTRSGYFLNTGSANVFLGQQAGWNLTSGDRNVLIGHRAGEDLATASDRLVISSMGSTLLSGSFAPANKWLMIASNLNMAGSTIQNLGSPISGGDATNRSWVESVTGVAGANFVRKIGDTMSGLGSFEFQGKPTRFLGQGSDSTAVFVSNGFLAIDNYGPTTVGLLSRGHIMVKSPEPRLLLISESGSQSREIEFGREVAGVPESRWNIGVNNAAEGGSNAGSDFYINRYSDVSTHLGTPLYINRQTGNIGFNTTSPAAPFQFEGYLALFSSTVSVDSAIKVGPAWESTLDASGLSVNTTATPRLQLNNTFVAPAGAGDWLLESKSDGRLAIRNTYYGTNLFVIDPTTMTTSNGNRRLSKIAWPTATDDAATLFFATNTLGGRQLDSTPVPNIGDVYQWDGTRWISAPPPLVVCPGGYVRVGPVNDRASFCVKNSALGLATSTPEAALANCNAENARLCTANELIRVCTANPGGGPDLWNPHVSQHYVLTSDMAFGGSYQWIAIDFNGPGPCSGVNSYNAYNVLTPATYLKYTCCK